VNSASTKSYLALNIWIAMLCIINDDIGTGCLTSVCFWEGFSWNIDYLRGVSLWHCKSV